MSNSQCASMTSRPLFISVAESMVIFGPMRQVGWRSASSGVTSRERGAAGSRGTVRPTRSGSAGGSRAARAVQALVDGVVLAVDGQDGDAAARAPRSSRSSPAMTSISLLASAMVLPASIAASTASSPAVPDEANSTTSTSGCVATATSPSARTRQSRSARAASRAKSGLHLGHAAGVAIAIVSGANCADLLDEARRVLPGGQRDDPQPIGMRGDDGERALADRSGRAENGDALHRRLQVPHEHVEDRRREQPAVDAIEDAAVAGDQGRRVLDAGAALEQRLEQIADHAERDHGQRRSATSSQRLTPRNTQSRRASSPASEHQPAEGAFDASCFGLIAGASGAGRTPGPCSTAPSR